MDELQKMAGELGELLKARGQTVGVAESSSGGLISAALLSIAGASAYYAGGGVVYTMQSRRRILDLRKSDVEGLQPLTEEMSAVFAERARTTFDATWGIAELGAAGPGGSRYGHPAGITAIAVAGPVPMTALIETGIDDRESNMWEFTRRSLDLLKQAVEASPVD